MSNCIPCSCLVFPVFRDKAVVQQGIRTGDGIDRPVVRLVR